MTLNQRQRRWLRKLLGHLIAQSAALSHHLRVLAWLSLALHDHRDRYLFETKEQKLSLCSKWHYQKTINAHLCIKAKDTFCMYRTRRKVLPARYKVWALLPSGMRSERSQGCMPKNCVTCVTASSRELMAERANVSSSSLVAPSSSQPAAKLLRAALWTWSATLISISSSC